LWRQDTSTVRRTGVPGNRGRGCTLAGGWRPRPGLHRPQLGYRFYDILVTGELVDPGLAQVRQTGEGETVQGLDGRELGRPLPVLGPVLPAFAPGNSGGTRRERCPGRGLPGHSRQPACSPGQRSSLQQRSLRPSLAASNVKLHPLDLDTKVGRAVPLCGPDLAAKAQNRERRGRQRREVGYGMLSPSADRADEARVLALVRGYWLIEVLRYIRDVTYDEDHYCICTDHAPWAMATLRKPAIALLRIYQPGAVARQEPHAGGEPPATARADRNLTTGATGLAAGSARACSTTAARARQAPPRVRHPPRARRPCLLRRPPYPTANPWPDNEKICCLLTLREEGIPGGAEETCCWCLPGWPQQLLCRANLDVSVPAGNKG